MHTLPMSGAPQPVLIWGAGGHAAMVADILSLGRDYVVDGFVDDVNPAPRLILGWPVLGGREALAGAQARGVRHAIVAVGACDVRLHLGNVLVSEGFTLATAVHPSAVVARSAVVGDGCVIAAGAIVGIRVTLGRSVIVNTRASVDHDCALDDGVHICPGACLAGTVSVGTAAWIGAGATVSDGLTIAAGSVIGVGAAVVHSIEAGVVAYGVPARVVRRV